MKEPRKEINGRVPFRSRSKGGFGDCLSARLVLVLGFVLVGTLAVNGVENLPSSEVRTQVSVTFRGDLRKSWTVKEAYLEENLTATNGYLELQNTSGRMFYTADFYAEYYDAAGRFCFSLVFSIDKNVGKKAGPFVRGETRNLYSVAAFLAPASEPSELRLFLLRESPPGEFVGSEEPPLQAPITTEIRVPTDPDRLWLGPELANTSGPVLDLVFASVTINSSGRLENVEILDAVSNSAKSWFLKFVANQVFYTATRSGVPQDGTALLLVRAIVSEKTGTQAPPAPARSSPWVINYLSEAAATSIPPITEIIFARPPMRVKMGETTNWTKLPVPPDGLFEPLTGASDWCSDIFAIVPDPSSPNHFRRQLPEN